MSFVKRATKLISSMFLITWGVLGHAGKQEGEQAITFFFLRYPLVGNSFQSEACPVGAC